MRPFLRSPHAAITVTTAIFSLTVTAQGFAQTPQSPQSPQAPPAAQAPQTPQAPQAPQAPQTPQTPQSPQTPQTPQSPAASPGTTHITSAPVVVSQAGQPVPATRESTSDSWRPNRKLLFGGVLTLGLAYVPAAVVGTTSEREGDRNLLIPVVGPWLNLGDRGPCNGPGQQSCSSDTANRVLIAVDGVFQAVGALQLIGAFIWPEPRRTVVVEGRNATPPPPQKLQMRVSPANIGRGGYGLSVVGTF